MILGRFVKAGCLFGAGFLSLGLWFSRRLVIKHETVPTSKLKAGTKPIKILHISDLHYGQSGAYKPDLWRYINELEYDFAVITGDIVGGHQSQLKPHIGWLKRLAQKTPVYFVDGNHEKFVYEEVAETLSEIGLTPLYDKRTVLTVRGFEMEIIGIRDYIHYEYTDFKGLSGLFEPPYNNSCFTLVLTHQPQMFDHIVKYKPDLTLCGHTHGGQVRLPFVPTLFAPGQGIWPKYGDGRYMKNGSALYVSRGIGTTVFPLRLFNPAEIAVISLCPIDY